MESRLDSPAPDHFARVKRGRGREGEPTEWTGLVASRKREIEGSPDLVYVTAGTSLRKGMEVIGAHAVKKSR
jgi:hypothetical protein